MLGQFDLCLSDICCLFYRVRMLFKATMSRLRRYCSHDVGSTRRKRQENQEELQYLDKELMTRAVISFRYEIAQVLLRIFFTFFRVRSYLLCFLVFGLLEYLINVRKKIRNIETHLCNSNKNKKFELRLTRRAKAYSSSCSQTVSLSPALFTKDWPTTIK